MLQLTQSPVNHGKSFYHLWGDWNQAVTKWDRFCDLNKPSTTIGYNLRSNFLRITAPWRRIAAQSIPSRLISHETILDPRETRILLLITRALGCSIPELILTSRRNLRPFLSLYRWTHLYWTPNTTLCSGPQMHSLTDEWKWNILKHLIFQAHYPQTFYDHLTEFFWPSLPDFWSQNGCTPWFKMTKHQPMNAARINTTAVPHLRGEFNLFPETLSFPTTENCRGVTISPD